MRHKSVLTGASILAFISFAASLSQTPLAHAPLASKGLYSRPTSALFGRIGFDDVDGPPDKDQNTGGSYPTSVQSPTAWIPLNDNEPVVVDVEGALPGRVWRSTKPIRETTLKPVSVAFKALGALKDTAYAVADLPDVVKEELDEYKKDKLRKEQLKLAQEREAQRQEVAREEAQRRAQVQFADTVDTIVGFPQSVKSTIETTVQALGTSVQTVTESVENTVSTIKALPEQVQSQVEETKASIALTVDDVVYAPVRFIDGIRFNAVRVQNAAIRTKNLLNVFSESNNRKPTYVPLPEPWAPLSRRTQLRIEAERAKEAEIAKQPKTIVLKIAGAGVKTGFTIISKTITAPFILANGVRKLKAKYGQSRERVENALLLEEEKTREKRERIESLKEAALEGSKRTEDVASPFAASFASKKGRNGAALSMSSSNAKKEVETAAVTQSSESKKGERNAASVMPSSEPKKEETDAASLMAKSEVKGADGSNSENASAPLNGAPGSKEGSIVNGNQTTDVLGEGTDGGVEQKAIEEGMNAIPQEFGSWPTKSTNTGA